MAIGSGLSAVIPGRRNAANYDAQLRIGEARTSGFDASHAPE
jgi:hypothetical protein